MLYFLGIFGVSPGFRTNLFRLFLLFFAQHKVQIGKCKIMTPWGLARIEIIASKEHITSELQRGVPMKQIHDALVSAGRVTVTYNSFRRQIQTIRDELKTQSVDMQLGHSKRAPNSSAKAVTRQMPPAKLGSKAADGFHFDPSCKAEDFF